MKLYRVTGKTAQTHGVIPDIALPDAAEVSSDREANEKFALPSTSIDANKYYQPLASLPVGNITKAIQSEIDTSAYFKATAQYIKQMQKAEQKKDISLSIDDIKQRSADKPQPPEQSDYTNNTHTFTVANHAYEQRRIQSNKNLQEANDELKENLANDPYLKAGFIIINAMIK